MLRPAIRLFTILSHSVAPGDISIAALAEMDAVASIDVKRSGRRLEGMKPTKTVILLIIVALAGGLWIRHYFSPGEVVKRKLLATVEAFEDESLLGVMAAVSRSYSDPWGFDYETLGANLHQIMDAYDDLDVDMVLGDVAASRDQVRIGLEFVVSGSFDGTEEYVVGSGPAPCTAVVVWRKEQPGWRLASTAELDIPELRDELEARRPR